MDKNCDGTDLDVKVASGAVRVSVEVNTAVRYSWITLISAVEWTVVRPVSCSGARHVVNYCVHVDAAQKSEDLRHIPEPLLT